MSSGPTGSACRSRTTTATWPRWRGPTGATRSTPSTCSPRACATAARSASPACTTGRSTACTCAPPACNLLALNTADPFDHRLLADVAALERRSGTELRELGRLGPPDAPPAGRARLHPHLAGTRRSTCWPAALRAATPERVALYLTSRGITNETYYVAGKAARAMGIASDRLRRPRVPRAVDGRPEGDHRRGRRRPARCRTCSRATSSCCGARTRPTTSRCS